MHSNRYLSEAVAPCLCAFRPGTASATVLGYFIEGVDEAEFQFAVSGLDVVPTVLPSESVLDLQVTCAPAKRGVFVATLYLATDTPENPLIPVKLWCSTPPALDVSPTRLTFGGVPLLTPIEKSVVVSNNGINPVLLTSASVAVVEGATIELANPLSGNTVLAAANPASSRYVSPRKVLETSSRNSLWNPMTPFFRKRKRQWLLTPVRGLIGRRPASYSVAPRPKWLPW